MKYCKTLSVIIMFALFACKKDDNNTPNTVDPAAVSAGTWRVSQFTDSGKDETPEFSGYTFTFNANGTAIATKSAADKTGTWSISSSNTKFNLDFGAKGDANKPLGELTDDWVIISINSSQIRLKDDNDDSGEVLTFSKN